jgi:hypothetical protein
MGSLEDNRRHAPCSIREEGEITEYASVQIFVLITKRMQLNRIKNNK